MVFRDDEGAEIVRIPQALLGTASMTVVSQSSSDSAPADSTGSVDEWSPDLWLLATADGEHWLTEDLEEPESGAWPVGAAVNGDSVLYQDADGWVLATLPTGD